MDKPHQVAPDIDVLPAHFPILDMGFLPVNAFVIKAAEPVLVDTGMGMDSEEFMKALESVIDPQDLKWVWLTHDDADHTGSIRKVLEAAPTARLAVNALAMLRMSTTWQVPMDRACWLNSGDSISVGDRKLTAVRPPLFDNPTTIGIYDEKSETFFSSDCFGAIISSPVQDADEVQEVDLAQGMIGWASVDSPWVHTVEPSKFNQELDRIRQMAPRSILSTHLPPARSKMEQFLKLLAAVPASEPFVAPDQAALEQILAQMRK
ncbi:putative flavoprotein [Candidatus Methanoperedens nitroreducens]|uniref:Putative flavoprotein n=1 Tax=Candidatus Methanoperedens nitratireducens TaxID=1392998 RepID=A0A062V6A3_9EURY|nr:MBL fold metallo-hydrolase [Candidatus Methanoperedens nitroreducens]KCZ72113.1 putative flavoprotein [Candidatus Methanoperedens nitroreducens]MDJ1421910.1 MBL fold metallo-hydrolase [Candidatus Methanoperedens sp.]